MRARVIALVTGLCVAGGASAQLTAAAAKPDKPSAITVVVEDLGCSTSVGADSFEARSWSWGATLATASGGSGGSGAGKATVEGLMLSRTSDACSPALLGALMSGKHFRRLTLSQYDASSVLKATVTLEGVTFTNWHIGGTDASAEAAEQVEASFDKFTFIDVASGSKVCFDVAAYKGC